MKNFTSLLSIALMVTPAVQAQRNVHACTSQQRLQSLVTRPYENSKPGIVPLKNPVIRNATKLGLSLAEGGQTSIWRTLHDKQYLFDEASAQWIDDSECDYTYYPDGQLKTVLLREADSWEQQTYEYNADGQLSLYTESESKDGNNFTPTVKREIKYDGVLKTQPVESLNYKWDEGQNQWVLDEGSFKRTIKRNAAGQIESSTVESYTEGDYHIYSQSIYTYNGHDKPVAYEFKRGVKNNGNYDLQTVNNFNNIVWENFDGNPPEEVFDLYYGGCRVASADIIEDGEKSGTLKATYSGENFVTEEVYDWQMVKIKVIYTVIDANGSNQTEEQDFMDMNEDGSYADDEVIFQSKVESIFNEHQHQTLDGYYEADPGMEYVLCDGKKFDYKYDSKTDCIAEKIDYYFSAKYDEDGYIVDGEFVKEYKLVADKFADVASSSGIGELQQSELQMERNGNALRIVMPGMKYCRLYDMQGHVVLQHAAANGNIVLNMSNLQPGIYILAIDSTVGSRMVKIAK